jgi:hypothetical protein
MAALLNVQASSGRRHGKIVKTDPGIQRFLPQFWPGDSLTAFVKTRDIRN